MNGGGLAKSGVEGGAREIPELTGDAGADECLKVRTGCQGVEERHRVRDDQSPPGLRLCVVKDLKLVQVAHELRRPGNMHV